MKEKKQSYDITDISLASQGRKKIEWAARSMPVLALIEKRFQEEKPMRNIRLGACLHVTAETANLMRALLSAGAEVFLCASNPLSTQDDVAASLVKDFGISVYARKGENNETYYAHLHLVKNECPQITMDDGADLVSMLHKLNIKNDEGKITVQNEKGKTWEFFGSSEETTTGIIRLKAMEKENALKIPVFAVNDSDTKHLFDNRYGTGQSTIDGILRATNMLLAGKQFVVVGYGWCGRGLASRARGMGAHVTIVEVDPIKALEAVMEGFQVLTMRQASLIGDIFVTVTGNKNVISITDLMSMKDGAVVANSGHFNVEIALSELEKNSVKKRQVRPFVQEYEVKNPKKKSARTKKIYVLGEGRLINLTAAEGHPADVMDMSFANQALAAEFFAKHRNKLKPKIYTISRKMDREIARLKLAAMGVKIQKLTREQQKYLSSWQEGT